MVHTILVTGSNGQLGKSLCALAEKDQKNQWVFCSRQDLDITNRENIEQIFVEHQPTHCINCAAFTNVRLAEKELDNARRINVDGVDISLRPVIILTRHWFIFLPTMCLMVKKAAPIRKMMR